MKKWKSRRNRRRGGDRPSVFFLIVFALGLIFLTILFVRGIGRAAPPGLPGAPPASQR